MAAYTKAWVIPFDEGHLGIAYERTDGVQGFLRLDRSGHPDLPELMKKLSYADLRRVEERLSNVVPFPGS